MIWLFMAVAIGASGVGFGLGIAVAGIPRLKAREHGRLHNVG